MKLLIRNRLNLQHHPAVDIDQVLVTRFNHLLGVGIAAPRLKGPLIDFFKFLFYLLEVNLIQGLIRLDDSNQFGMSHKAHSHSLHQILVALLGRCVV